MQNIRKKHQDNHLTAIALLLCLAIGLTQEAFSQAVLRVRNYSQRDFEQGVVTQMMQDSAGYIWLATFNGLLRYDGYDFVHYKNQPGDSIHLSNNRLEDLYLTRDGNIVCRSYDNKLYLFDTHRFCFTAKYDTLPTNDIVDCPTSSRDKPSHAITYNASDLPSEIQKAISAQNGKEGSVPFMAFHDRWGDTWIQLNNGILYYYNPSHKRLEEATFHEDGQQQVLHTDAQLPMQDQQGNIWYRDSDNGLNYLCLESRTYDEIIHPLQMQPRAMLTDRDGRLWVGWKHTSKTEFGSLSLYDRQLNLQGFLSTNGELKLQAEQAPFDLGGVYSLVEDRHGNIWIGTRYSGLYILQPTTNAKKFKCYHYEAKEGSEGALQNNSIYHIAEDASGRIWLATWGQSIHITDPSADLSKLSFYPIKNTQIENLRTEQENLVRRVRHIFFDHQGQLIVSTESGLLTCNDPSLSHEQLKFKLISNNGEANSLHGGSIQHVSELRDHRLLISTLSGLNATTSDNPLNTNSFYNCLAEGVQGHNVYSTIQATEGTIWVVTESSVMMIDDSLKQAVSVFPNAEVCSEAIPIRDQHKRLYFSLDNTVFCLRDTAIEKPEWTPQIVLNKLSRIDKGYGFYNISWSSIDYRNPQGIKYAYKIINKDNTTFSDWIEIDNNHTLKNLTTAHYGSFLLLIRSTDAEGFWCDNTIEIPLEFNPTFQEYLNAFFFILLLVAICIILFQMIRYWSYRKKHKQAVEALLNSERNSVIIDDQPSSSMMTGTDDHRRAEKPTNTAKADQMQSEDIIFLQKLDQFIEKNILSGDLNIQLIAEKAGMSRTVFYRYLKSITGVAPVEYVRIYKVKRACQLLADPKKTLTEVAYESGFGTSQSFTKAFKEVKKCTPKEFRSKFVQSE